MTTDNRISFYIYKPNKNLSLQRSLDKTQCARSVHESGRGVGHYQCTRKPYKEIDGYGFCKQHYSEIIQRLGLDESETTIRYAAEFSYGDPNLVRLELYSETEETITVKSVEDIIGTMFFMNGRQKRNTTFTNRQYFIEKQDALDYLHEKSIEYFNACQEKLDHAVSVIKFLDGLREGK